MPPAVEYGLDCLGIRPMLLDEDARRQRIDRVIVQHRHAALHDDRAAIELRCHKVHRHTGELYAVLERLSLRVDARKRRKERRMDIENGIRKRLEHGSADEPHEPSQADQADMTRAQGAHECAVELIAYRERAMTDVERLDPGLAGTIEARRFGTIRDDNRNLGLEATFSNRIDYSLKVTAAPRDENADPPVHDTCV